MSEIKDYIDNYSLYTEVDYRYADGAVRAKYDKMLTDRIDEIFSTGGRMSAEGVDLVNLK